MMDEGSVKIRLAHPSDAELLGKIHFICSSVQPGGFMHHLGRRFFVKYYKIILKLRTSVVLCADAGRDGIVGFVSATLDAKDQLDAIRKGRLKLFWAAIPGLARKPSQLWGVYIRNRSLSAKIVGEGFVLGSGPRIVYWGWLPGYPSKGKSICLMEELMRLMKSLGASKLHLEVDHINRKVEIIHRLLGAKVIRKFITRDGRERIVMEHNLNRMLRKI